MKKILLTASLLFTTPVLADNPATLTCYFQSGEHFTVVGQGGTSMIQWDTKGFRSAISNFENPWLTVVEVADNGNRFKMVFNAKTKQAYGETQFVDGHTSGGPLWCAFQ
jgi:hypothetical protein